MDDKWPIDEENLWQVLCSQPEVGVHLLDGGAKIVFANPQAVELFTGSRCTDVVGKTVEEFTGPGYAGELKRLIRQVIDTARPSLLKHVRFGRLLHIFLWPTGTKRVLAVTRPGSDIAAADVDFPVVQSEFADWGPLNVLSPRELEVLALIGHGMPTKKIADELSLSPKTIERHRTSIGRKLKVKSLAELTRLVHDAGLTLERVENHRLDPPSLYG